MLLPPRPVREVSPTHLRPRAMHQRPQLTRPRYDGPQSSKPYHLPLELCEQIVHDLVDHLDATLAPSSLLRGAWRPTENHAKEYTQNLCALSKVDRRWRAAARPKLLAQVLLSTKSDKDDPRDRYFSFLAYPVRFHSEAITTLHIHFGGSDDATCPTIDHKLAHIIDSLPKLSSIGLTDLGRRYEDFPETLLALRSLQNVSVLSLKDDNDGSRRVHVQTPYWRLLQSYSGVLKRLEIVIWGEPRLVYAPGFTKLEALHLTGCALDLDVPPVVSGVVKPVLVKDLIISAERGRRQDHLDASEVLSLKLIESSKACLEVLTLRSASLRALAWWIHGGPDFAQTIDRDACLARLRRLEVVDQQTSSLPSDLCPYLLDAIDTEAAAHALPALTELTLEWAPSLHVALVVRLAAGRLATIKRIRIVGEIDLDDEYWEGEMEREALVEVAKVKNVQITWED